MRARSGESGESGRSWAGLQLDLDHNSQKLLELLNGNNVSGVERLASNDVTEDGPGAWG